MTRRSFDLEVVAEIAAAQGGFVLARQLAELRVPGSTVTSRARTGGPRPACCPRCASWSPAR